MERREFILRASAAASLAVVDPRALFARAPDDEGWRTYEITTRVEVLQPRGATRVWLPTPLAVAPYQKTMGDTSLAPGGSVVMIETTANEPDMLGAHWDEGVPAILTLTSRVATRDMRPISPHRRSRHRAILDVRHFLRPTRLIPTDGIVKQTAYAITRGAGTDLEKARAITSGSSTTRSAIRRPSGVEPATSASCWSRRTWAENAPTSIRCSSASPARPACRRAMSGAFAWRSPKRSAQSGLVVRQRVEGAALPRRGLSGRLRLGARRSCGRAKGGLDEPPGNLPLSDERVTLARGRLFGSWEMNWIAYDVAHDVSLRGSTRKPIGYFMYPQGETASGPIDSLTRTG